MKYYYQKIEPGQDFVLLEESCSIGADLSKEEKEEVERIWENETARRKRLFNGRLLTMLKRGALVITGGFVDYKYYLAVKKNPELKKVLPIIPLSVCCMTVCGDAVLVGKRSIHVTDYAGYYELAPSGGIEPAALMNGKLDFFRQACLELTEETTLPCESIKASRLFGILYEVEPDCLGLCVEIQIGEDYLQRPLPSTEEYTELRWVAFNELAAFCNEQADRLLPASQFLLQQILHTQV